MRLGRGVGSLNGTGQASNAKPLVKKGNAMNMRGVIAMTAVLASTSAHAQYTDGVVKIGILTDMSGVYSDIGGPGSVVAAKLAVEDFGAAAKGIKVVIVGADMQNKPDVGASIAGTWFDVDNVDVIVDGLNSGVSLVVSDIARQKNKLFVATGAATPDLTGPKCNANTIQWVYDSWALAHGTGKAVMKTGGDTWFFLTVDYAGGYALERDAVAVVEANGGKVLGKVRHPLNTNDFSSYLLQARTSRAKVIGLANAGGDTIMRSSRQQNLVSSRVDSGSLASCFGQAMSPRSACRSRRASF